MKRKISGVMAFLFLLFALAAAGNRTAAEGELRGYSREAGYVYVHLGRYPQTEEGGVEPILWRVLTADGEKAYLLSEYVLFARAMHTSLKDYRDELKGDFSQTELCSYLNTTFAGEAFTEAETEMLLPCENFGKVFLLSLAEMKDKEIGLGVTLKDSKNAEKIREDPGIRAWGTAWALNDNGYPKSEYPNPKERVRNAADMADISVAEKRLFAYSDNRGGVSPFWGRTQSTSDGRHAVVTKANGSVGHIEVGRDNIGVRPAVYLAQGSFRIASGSGTREDPFEIVPAGEK